MRAGEFQFIQLYNEMIGLGNEIWDFSHPEGFCDLTNSPEVTSGDNSGIKETIVLNASSSEINSISFRWILLCNLACSSDHNICTQIYT